MEDVDDPPPLLQKGEGEGLVDAIARNQQRIDPLKIQRDGIRRGGFPANHVTSSAIGSNPRSEHPPSTVIARPGPGGSIHFRPARLPGAQNV